MTESTIVDTVSSIVDLYNEDFQYYKEFKNVDPANINTWDFEECKCADSTYINTYFNQKRFFDRLQFMDSDTKRVIENLKKIYDVSILTMGFRPNCIGKQLWISKNLPDTKTICVNMKQYKDKSHIDMSDAIILDDKSENLITSNAREKILFGYEFSWNNDWNGKRLYDWLEVEDYLMRGER